MTELDDILARLSPQHRTALQWFRERTGQDIPWPKPLPDGTHLVSRHKGINKPGGWRHALSIRQALKSHYADEDAVSRPDGTWSLRYFQEKLDPGERDGQFTNRALMACKEDAVPIAVLRQIRGKGKDGVLYRILGLARVTDWHEDGYFVFEGYSLAGERHAVQASIGRRVGKGLAPAPSLKASDADRGSYDPADVKDARERVFRTILARRGQKKFRDALVNAYQGRCAVTGCDVLDILEAAHITPYLGPDTNDVTNGLLLRADLHTLFDAGLIAVEPSTREILVAPTIKDPVYRGLHGQFLRKTTTRATAPSEKALTQHKADCRW